MTSYWNDNVGVAMEMAKRQRALLTYHKKYHLPDNLYYQMLDFIKSETSDNHSVMEQEFLICHLPPSFRNEIDAFKLQGLVNEVSFFRDKNPAFVLKIVNKMFPLTVPAGNTLYS